MLRSSIKAVSFWLSVISYVGATTHKFIYELWAYFFAYDIFNPIQDGGPKNWVFWSDLYKIQFMITSLIEMLMLQNFGYMSTSTIWLESTDKILLVTSCTRIIMS